MRAEPTQDYIAALAGVLARLVSYYDQGPYCGGNFVEISWKTHDLQFQILVGLIQMQPAVITLQVD